MLKILSSSLVIPSALPKTTTYTCMQIKVVETKWQEKNLKLWKPSLVLHVLLAKRTMLHWHKKRQFNIDLKRAKTSNVNIHTQRKAISRTKTNEQSIRHVQTIHSYRLILINTKTSHDTHILACFHTRTYAQNTLEHIHTIICNYSICIYVLKIQTPRHVYINKMSIHSLHWYDANSVTKRTNVFLWIQPRRIINSWRGREFSCN